MRARELRREDGAAGEERRGIEEERGRERGERGERGQRKGGRRESEEERGERD